MPPVADSKHQGPALKRAYEPPSPDDGARILVDRVWPRGLPRQALQLDDWLKDLAPSSGLRRWFGHDPDRWDAFRERYFAELDGAGAALERLRAKLRSGKVTLVYGARDERHNNAVALKQYLEARNHD